MATKKPAGKTAGKMEAKPAAAPDPEKSEAMASMAVRPSVNAAAVMASYGKPLGGKARTSRNGFKGGHRETLRELARVLNEALREQREALRRR